MTSGAANTRTTPPHLAQRELVYATPERTDDFFRAVLHGFHDDYVPEKWEPHRKVFEADRSFGFQVDGQWISTCGAYSRTLTVPGGSVPVAAVTIVTVHPSYLLRLPDPEVAELERRRFVHDLKRARSLANDLGAEFKAA